MMTIHASGGRAMMQAVANDLRQKFGDKKPIVVAVTVLTSLDTKALFEMGWEMPLDEQVNEREKVGHIFCPDAKVQTKQLPVKNRAGDALPMGHRSPGAFHSPLVGGFQANRSIREFPRRAFHREISGPLANRKDRVGRRTGRRSVCP